MALMVDSGRLGTVVGIDAESAFRPMSARRLLVLGGIGLILVGMLFGDIFAVFVLHQNAAKVGESLSSAAHAAVAGDARAVALSFQAVGSFLENRGTKVDTHVHMIAFGYLALMLADFGGALVILATLAYLFGVARRFRRPEWAAKEDGLLADRSMAGRVLFAGGLGLVLLGFLHGAYYAGVDLYRHEALDYSLLSEMTSTAAARNGTAVDTAVGEYGELAGEKAVNIAAHAHAIEFGLLAMLLGFFQGYVRLCESWKRNWAWLLLLGSLVLPVFVLLELRLGLLAG